MSEFYDDTDHISPAFQKLTYQQIFYNPDGQLDAFPTLDFYAAAQVIAKRLAARETLAEIESMAALFLFRHYLEVRLKEIVFYARSLESKDKNRSAEDVQWESGHDLQKLWKEAKNQVPRKLGAGILGRVDYQFAECCIEEFHTIDPTSEYLRYGWEKKTIARDKLNPMRVSWDALLFDMDHTKDVLEEMHSYLVETHGQNADWEDELNSL